MNTRPVIAGLTLLLTLVFSPLLSPGPLAVPDLADATEAPDPAVVAAGGTEAWWSKALQNIKQQEYEVSQSAAGLQAPNRAQNLRTYFHDSGIEVVPRDVLREEAPWRFEWQTVGWGREDHYHLVDSAPPHHSSARVEYRHAGGLTEWYVNRPEGLEQGFQVSTRPEGKGELVIAGLVPPDLRAELAADGQWIDFRDAGGAGLIRYAELHVLDATGRELPAHLAMDGYVVQILTDDRDAVYPLDVDPCVTDLRWEAEGNDAGAHFGTSVSIAGNVDNDDYSDIIVGAPSYDAGGINDGRAFMYLGSADGPSDNPDWTADGETHSDNFGHSVSTAGDVDGDGYDDVIVGAPYAHNGLELFEGVAYVFRGCPDGLEDDHDWTAEGNQTNATFGWSVSTAGDVDDDDYADVIVGAYLHDTIGRIDAGMAYVYLGSAEGLADVPVWTEANDVNDAWFGHSVSTAGDVNGDGYDDVLVGSPYWWNGMEELFEGCAYLYLGSVDGPENDPEWTAESNQTNAGDSKNKGPFPW